MTELLPCPFCGGGHIERNSDRWGHWYFCDCEARGGYGNSPAEAALRWNARAQPQRSKQRSSDLTKLAAECHRAKWQFDFNDENRLSVGQARDMVKRAFDELYRIGDMALKLRDEPDSRPLHNTQGE